MTRDDVFFFGFMYAALMIVCFGFMLGHNRRQEQDTTFVDVLLCIFWPVALLINLGYSFA